MIIVAKSSLTLLVPNNEPKVLHTGTHSYPPFDEKSKRSNFIKLGVNVFR